MSSVMIIIRLWQKFTFIFLKNLFTIRICRYRGERRTWRFIIIFLNGTNANISSWLSKFAQLSTMLGLHHWILRAPWRWRVFRPLRTCLIRQSLWPYLFLWWFYFHPFPILSSNDKLLTSLFQSDSHWLRVTTSNRKMVLMELIKRLVDSLTDEKNWQLSIHKTISPASDSNNCCYSALLLVLVLYSKLSSGFLCYFFRKLIAKMFHTQIALFTGLVGTMLI